MKWIIAVLLLSLPSLSHAGDWHILHPSKSVAASKSYRFLVSKFGTAGILVQCDPESAAMVGPGYLWSARGDSPNPHRDGLAGGWGSTLQEALDSAAMQYMPGPRVQAVDEELTREEKETAAREAKYRKKCNCN